MVRTDSFDLQFQTQCVDDLQDCVKCGITGELPIHEHFSGEWVHAYYAIYLWDSTLSRLTPHNVLICRVADCGNETA